VLAFRNQPMTMPVEQGLHVPILTMVRPRSILTLVSAGDAVFTTTWFVEVSESSAGKPPA